MGSTQIILWNFPEDVRAKEIADLLRASVGLVCRCKLKISAPPNLDTLRLATENAETQPECKHHSTNFTCHAYVHFLSPEVAKEACAMANAGRLFLRGSPLRAQLPTEGFSVRTPRSSDLLFTNVLIDCGTLCSWGEFLVSWKSPSPGVTLEVDRVEKKCRFLFCQQTWFLGRDRSNAGSWSVCEFKLEFLFRDIRFVHEANCRLDSDEGSSLLLQLFRPPWIFYRMADGEVYSNSSFRLIDQDPWIRTVDFTKQGSIGRHLTYLLNFSPRQTSNVRKVMGSFRREGLHIKQKLPSLDLPHENGGALRKAEFFFSVPFREDVKFEHLILVNSLVHQGIVNASSLKEEFFGLLKNGSAKSETLSFALRHMLSYTTPLFDPIKRLEQVIKWVSKMPDLRRELKVLEGRSLIYRLTITPTKAYCSPPEYDISNRILRQYNDYSDRFLRVSFLDDNLQTLKPGVLNVPLSPVSGDRASMKTSIFKRVLAVLREGFDLCGRRYSFLAFSANQLREHSAWFFANHPSLTADHIRNQMGEMPKKVVAKYAARMGQCFSSTYATVKIKTDEMTHIRDIMQNGYNFSDGIGKITPSLAKEVCDILQLKGSPPSAFQIRYAGYKGVVATWAHEHPKSPHRLLLRLSMAKFNSTHPYLEVVGWTRFFPCFLNRQIITLLSTLQVPDRAFMELQITMVQRLTVILQHPQLALEILTRSCNGELHQTTILMLRAGFKASSEPHLKEMLQSIRVLQMDDLLNKARIFVPNGRWLMGCLDELNVLEYGQCFIRVTYPDEMGGSDPTMQVITGKLVMAKNPCLHPGDIRILEAVDVPELHHQVDCLVLPQRGPRPHQDEASGSDLDGDVYFACWECSLIPPSGTSWEPMDYVQPVPADLGRAVKIDDIMEFFAKQMITDSLGKICNAHVVHADLSPVGALDEKCLQLAKLAALAVDFAKTGVPAVMPYELRPKKYPDFMAKTDCPTYTSEKILGKLYRHAKEFKVKDAEHLENFEQIEITDIPYDMDLEISGFESFCDEAWKVKCAYEERVKALMGQFNVQSEGEIVIGSIASVPGFNSKRLGNLRDRLREGYLALRDEYRIIFENGLPETQPGQEEQTKQLRQAKASGWYHVTYHRHWVQKTREAMDPDIPFKGYLLSFPWIMAEILCDIKLAANKNSDINTLCSLTEQLKAFLTLELYEDLNKPFCCVFILYQEAGFDRIRTNTRVELSTKEASVFRSYHSRAKSKLF